MSPLLIMLETRTLPGFPVAPDPGPLQILIYAVLIPVLISGLITVLGLGRRWLSKDSAVPPAADGPAEVLPTAEELAARRELVQRAAVHNEARADLRVRAGKSDPAPYHP